MLEWILIRLLRLLGHLRCQKGGKIRGKHPFVKKELVKWEVNIRYSVKSSITSTWVASIAQFHIPFGILIVDSISFIKRFTYLLWLIVLAFSSIGIVLSVDFQHIKTMRKVINQCLGLSKYVASAKKFCDDISIAHMHIYAHICTQHHWIDPQDASTCTRNGEAEMKIMQSQQKHF